jgi:hypothetical protein
MPKRGSSSAATKAKDDATSAAQSDGSNEQPTGKSQKKNTPLADVDDDDDLMPEAPPATMDSLMAAITMLVTRSDEQAQSTLTREANLATMMTSFENKFAITDDHLAKVDATLAKIQARLDGIDADSHTSKNTQAGQPASASAGAPASAWRPLPASPSSRSPPSSSNSEWFKVFFDGPSHALHRLTHGRYWNEKVKPLVSADLVAGTRVFAGNNPGFAVGFPSESAAKDFLDNLAAKQGPPILVDLDGISHTMKANYQRSKVPTKFGKQLSYLHQHYHDKLCARDGYGTDFKLVTDAHRGRVYVERGERLFMLHTVNTDGATLRTFEDGLTEFKLDIAASRAAALLFAAV